MRPRWWCWPLALSVVVIGACSPPPPVADGADVDRPPEPSMAMVELRDVAAEVGLDFHHGAFRWDTTGDPMAMMGGGLCWIDYDGDGWLDLYLVDTWSDGEWGRWRQEGQLPSSRLYHNEFGTFVDVTEETGAGVETRGSGCVAADLDADGWTDLYLTTERENVLLWNEEGTGFVDDASLPQPSGAGVYGWHTGAAVGDLDHNGWPDLYVVGYADLNRPIPSSASGFPTTHQPEPDLLLLNGGPGDGGRARFRDVAAEVGVEPDGADYGLGVVLSDLDADGDLDIYVANDTTPNDLYLNTTGEDGPRSSGDPGPSPGPIVLIEQGEASGVADRGAGMGVAAGDFDLDGAPDLVVTNQKDEHHMVYRQPGSLRFDGDPASTGLPQLGIGSTGWGVTWVDLDLDTDLDLVVANGAIPVRHLGTDGEGIEVFENRTSDGRPGELVDASSVVGLDQVGSRLGRGLAAADYDNDGDLDLVIGSIGGPVTLLRNTGAGGNWLVVAPPGPSPGTRVMVELPDGQRLERELRSGGSYLSSEDPRAHFGLGAADRVERLVVTWPDGSVTEHRHLAANQIVAIEPGEQ